MLAVAAAPTAFALACGGDCNHDRRVTIDELLTGVNIVLGTAALDQCPAFDCNGDGDVGVDCLVRGVSAALSGCPSNVANPTLEGPVTGNGAPFIAATSFDLSEVGYTQAEYFMAGTAAAYVNVGELGADGKWTVEPAAEAAYKTRILVYRPIAPERFNGTVIVEWLNVSGGLDAAPDWIMGHTELIRAGYAWVGVSAQIVGVEGGTPLLPVLAIPLKTQNPERYGSLVHPGDSFSYDIFSQAGQAIRHPAGTDPLGGLPIATVIAIGESQSAFRLVTYINAIHRLADIYDGYFVHSRGGVPLAALSEPPLPAIPAPGTAPIRDDLDVPVLTFETETDLIILGYLTARQPDSDRFRLWEVAGTAHADTYTLAGMADLGDSPDAAKPVISTMPVPGVTCDSPINSGPQHFVQKAALAALNRWVREGTPPPIAPRLQVDAGAIVRDAHGNALGGIRTPQVDVPIAAFSGIGQGSLVCQIFGSTMLFDEATLAALYPDHDAYVSAFNQATDQTVQAGFILAPDAELMKAAAAESDVGG
jgi:hypothetical protein